MSATLLAILGVLVIVQPAFAAGQAPVQTYFVPLPEDTLFHSFDTINPPNVYGSVHTLVAVAVAANNTVIYYDDWEDGYEQDVTNPSQSTTKIWGDNNPANGSPPGFPGDVLSGGDAIILENLVPLPRNPSTVLYDGRDRIQASFPVAVTRGAWPQHPGSLLAGATEVWETTHWGTSYVVPVGQNTSIRGDTDPFEYAAVYIMAGQDNTQVSLNGLLIATLNAGETYVARVNQGVSITSTAPVQVDLVTGDINSEYEMRWYSLVPRNDWSNDSYTPVGNSSHQTKVWLYNPGTRPLVVSYDFLGGSSPDGTISVPAHGVALSPHVPNNSGARFRARGDFFALTQTDTDSSTGGATSDWGHSLIPADMLSSQALVGWGYGNTSNNPSIASRSVVWVTPVSNATTHIDFNGDGVVDNTRSLSALASLKVLDDSSVFSGAQNDQDMTGAIIFATDGSGAPVDIAVAWGQDPARSFSGDNEALDLGTVVLPLPLVSAAKSAVLVTDADGNGKFSLGDTMKYVIRVVNIGRVDVPANSVTISDDVPTHTTYVASSTQYYDGATTSPISDSGGTAFPLDEGGIGNLSDLLVGTAHEVSFEVVIDASFACPRTIVNQALVAANEDITARVETQLQCEDFGDAPESYGTTRSANGASNILGDVRLGHTVDGEATGQPTSAADGDDTLDADGDDENGVNIPATLTPGQTSTVVVSVENGDGVLSAWVDWNQDGDFTDAGEDVFINLPLNNGDHFLNLNVPITASPGSTYARFRLTAGTSGSINSDNPNGAAGVGEVEDYQVVISNPLAITLASFDAQAQAGHVLVTRETASELQNSGFNLYRTVTADPPTAANLLTFVPSQGPGSAQGFFYSHQDYDVTAGQTYWYWLEDVDLSGATSMHGPVSVVYAAPTAVTLSGLEAATGQPAALGWPWLLPAIAAALALAVASRRRSRA